MVIFEFYLPCYREGIACLFFCLLIGGTIGGTSGASVLFLPVGALTWFRK